MSSDLAGGTWYKVHESADHYRLLAYGNTAQPGRNQSAVEDMDGKYSGPGWYYLIQRQYGGNEDCSYSHEVLSTSEVKVAIAEELYQLSQLLEVATANGDDNGT